MIFRLTQKLAKKIKIGKREDAPTANNALADWSANVFVAKRQQYILLSNTQSLYSCILSGRGITSESTFIDGAMQTIDHFLSEDGLHDVFQRFLLPASQKVNFAKSLNRSVTGSMTDLIIAAKFHLEIHDLDLSEIAGRLNVTPLSALVDAEGRKYNCPKSAIRLLLANSDSTKKS